MVGSTDTWVIMGETESLSKSLNRRRQHRDRMRNDAVVEFHIRQQASTREKE